MEDFRLLTSQKNKVLQAIVAEGLNPGSFRWVDVRSQARRYADISRLEGPEGSFFNFDRDPQSFFLAEYSPGLDQRVTKKTGYEWNNFRYVNEWAAALKRELETPDLWALVEAQPKDFQALIETQSESDRFTAAELEEVKRGLEEIKEFLFTTEQVSGAQRAMIELRLKYLLDAAPRVGRVDWKNIAFSTFVSILLQLALPPSTAGELFRFVVVALRHVLGGQALLP